MNKVIKKNKSYTEIVKNSQVATYAIPQTSDNTDLRAIIMEEKNEQLAAETEKKMRFCNLILHGVKESITVDKNQSKQRDEEFITTFIEDLWLEIKYKSIYRLGREAKKEQSKRPIRVVMYSERGRDRIMMNLKQLKGQEKYKGVSMTDDHTIKDRNVIQERVEKAKRAKANEWKVRGTPKNGMCLKKSQIWKAGE